MEPGFEQRHRLVIVDEASSRQGSGHDLAQDAAAGSGDRGAAAGRGAGGHRIICLEQSAARALAAGAITDEIASAPVKQPLISYDN